MPPDHHDLAYLWDMRIIGLRNILAHAYGEVKLDRIYLAASESVPALLKSLIPLIPE